jgi:hypothetical protein
MDVTGGNDNFRRLVANAIAWTFYLEPVLKIEGVLFSRKRLSGEARRGA